MLIAAPNTMPLIDFRQTREEMDSIFWILFHKRDGPCLRWSEKSYVKYSSFLSENSITASCPNTRFCSRCRMPRIARPPSNSCLNQFTSAGVTVAGANMLDEDVPGRCLGTSRRPSLTQISVHGRPPRFLAAGYCSAWRYRRRWPMPDTAPDMRANRHSASGA